MNTLLTAATPAAGLDRATSSVAFRTFVEPHWPAMKRLARRLAIDGHPDDVLQEALITAWRKRGQYDPERGTVRNWLLAIVADKAYKSRRGKRGRTAQAPVPEATTGSDSSARLDVRTAVAGLARRQRIAVTLHYYLGLTTAETAEVMSCSPGTVKSTLADARRQLKNALGEDYSHA